MHTVPIARGRAVRAQRRAPAALLAWLVAAACACGSTATSPPPAPRNVVLVSLDTCRADHLGAYGKSGDPTPNIDAVARDGIVYTRAHSTNVMTLPAHCSMLTGTIPPAHGVHGNNARLADDVVTLAERLRDAGRTTGAFIGAVVLDGQFGIGQGFQTYGDRFTQARHTGDVLYTERRAEEVSDEAIAWLEAHRAEPFFLFLHYFDPHQPYQPPEPFATRFAADPYTGDIAYTDHHVGRVLDALRRLRLDGSTLVVVTADHGQSLGEHGEETHGYLVHEATLRVPLVVRTPGVPAARVDEPVSLVDIVPTVLALTGLPPVPGLDGRELPGLSARRAAAPAEPTLYFESFEPGAFGCAPYQGLFDGDWKFIAGRAPALYDVARDPKESADRAAAEPERVRQLGTRLDTLLAARTRKADAQAMALDPATAARLRSLGYLGEAAVDPHPATRGQADDPGRCFAAYTKYLAAQTALDDRRFADARRDAEAALGERPETPKARALLGTIALEQQQLEEAVGHFTRYLAAIDGDAGTVADDAVARVHANLGRALAQLDRMDEAVVQLRKATARAPWSAEAHNNLGTVLMMQGSLDDAATEFRAAIQSSPRMGVAHKNLGRVLVARGRPADAVPHLEIALEEQPTDAELAPELGDALLAAGDPTRALERLDAALRTTPTAPVYNAIAWIRATCTDPGVHDAAAAVTMGERAAALAGSREPWLLDTLAATYAAANRFPDAVAASREAQQKAHAAGEDALAADIGTRLALYEKGQAYGVQCTRAAGGPS